LGNSTKGLIQHQAPALPALGADASLSSREQGMIYLLAILLPWLALLLRGRIFQGILCLILQITLLGWIPAAIWAILVINNDDADRRTRELIQAGYYRR
jgi:uncharacterized membrane protein YqaE (UPF0057 family)